MTTRHRRYPKNAIARRDKLLTCALIQPTRPPIGMSLMIDVDLLLNTRYCPR